MKENGGRLLDSGGAWEYVMGNYNDIVGNSGFASMPDLKYYNSYTDGDYNIACNGSVCLSHALSETVGWYNDHYNMLDEERSWMIRGGHYTLSHVGIFYVTGVSYFGSSEKGGTFRLVVTIR